MPCSAAPRFHTAGLYLAPVARRTAVSTAVGSTVVYAGEVLTRGLRAASRLARAPLAVILNVGRHAAGGTVHRLRALPPVTSRPMTVIPIILLDLKRSTAVGVDVVTTPVYQMLAAFHLAYTLQALVRETCALSRVLGDTTLHIVVASAMTHQVFSTTFVLASVHTPSAEFQTLPPD